MSDNWVVQMLSSALNVWNDKLAEILKLVTMSPQEFKNGAVWNIMVGIHNALMAVGLALLVLFFVVGVMKTCGNFAEIKRPEIAVKLFIRFILAKAVVTYGMELMLALLSIIQGVISTVLSSAGLNGGDKVVLPEGMINAIEKCGFFESIPLWIVSLLGVVIVWILSLVMILTVYGRFFKLYMFTAIAPIPLSSFAGEPTQSMGKNFLKSYAGVCLQGVIIVLGCIIFSVFAATPPVVDAELAASTQVWTYIGEIVFNMLILVGSVRMADRLMKEMMGL